MNGASINFPAFYQEPREIAEVWRLTKGERTGGVLALSLIRRAAKCDCSSDGEWYRGEVGDTVQKRRAGGVGRLVEANARCDPGVTPSP